MKKGFTILELLVVISVLVILIGIAIPRFKGMQDAGKLAQAKAELQTMQVAVESYYMNQSTPAYPGSTTATVTTLGQSYLVGATPQMISSPLYDPFGGTQVEYKYVKNSGYYVIGSVGAAGSGIGSLAITSAGTVSGVAGGNCVTNGTGC